MLTITKLHLKGTRYYISEGTANIAWFSDLYTAAIVLRYLRGADLTKTEHEHAVEALQAFDAKGNK